MFEQVLIHNKNSPARLQRRWRAQTAFFYQALQVVGENQPEGMLIVGDEVSQAV